MLNRSSQETHLDIPLIGPTDRHAPLAWRGGRPVNRGAFLADVYRLADRLPDRRHVVNDCADRYGFLVGLAAAILRGQMTHMPNDKTQHSLLQLMEAHEDLYCLTDGEPTPIGVERVNVEVHGDSDADDRDVPTVARDRIVAQVYTAGTTGHPKPNAKTWGALVDGAWRINAALELQCDPGPVIVATVPAQHMFGLELSVMVPLREGISMHPGRPFYPADMKAVLRELLPRSSW